MLENNITNSTWPVVGKTRRHKHKQECDVRDRYWDRDNVNIYSCVIFPILLYSFTLQNLDLPEIEKEVKRLLRTDNEATSIRWEVIREEDEKKNNADTNISSSNLDGKYIVFYV